MPNDPAPDSPPGTPCSGATCRHASHGVGLDDECDSCRAREKALLEQVAALRIEQLELRRATASLVSYARMRDGKDSVAAELVEAEGALKATPKQVFADYRQRVEFAAEKQVAALRRSLKAAQDHLLGRCGCVDSVFCADSAESILGAALNQPPTQHNQRSSNGSQEE